MKKALSQGEELLALQIRALKLPVPQREFHFKDDRKWAFDFYWPYPNKIAVECDGGNTLATITKTGRAVAVGRHTKPDDYRKLNAATLLGFRVLRFTTEMIKSGEAISILEKELAHG